MEILGGTAGWSYEDWVGPFYPADPPRGFSRLEFYSRFFDCVEVDSTFYRHFPPRVGEKWIREVGGNDRFTFLLKLYKGFTHGRDAAADASDDRSVVSEFIQPFQEKKKFGGLLVQFSEYFRDTAGSREKVSSIAEQFPGVRLFFELRHLSWYTPSAAEFIKSGRLNVIAIDQPELKGMAGLNPDIVGDVGYFRLHGRNEKAWERGRNSLARKGRSAVMSPDDAHRNDRYNYLYNARELDEIETKIRRVGERCDRIYVVANNHPMGKAVANALELVKRLRNNDRVKVPDTVIKYFPELKELSDIVSAGGEDTLF